LTEIRPLAVASVAESFFASISRVFIGLRTRHRAPNWASVRLSAGVDCDADLERRPGRSVTSAWRS
jgi:hypothetical protein